MILETLVTVSVLGVFGLACWVAGVRAGQELADAGERAVSQLLAEGYLRERRRKAILQARIEQLRPHERRGDPEDFGAKW